MAQFPTFQAGGDPNHILKGVSIQGLYRPVPKVTGRVYAILPGRLSTAGAVAAIDTIYFMPFFMPDTFNFTAGKLRVGTGGAGSSVKCGIWANSTVSNRPVGAPLFVDNTGVATTSSSTDVTVALGTGSLASGFYWSGVKFTGTLPTMAVTTDTSAFSYMMGSTVFVTYCLSLADTYSNAMPTLTEGQALTENANGNNTVVLGLVAA